MIALEEHSLFALGYTQRVSVYASWTLHRSTRLGSYHGNGK